MNFKKSFFWSGIILSIFGGAMYCFERFIVNVSHAIITAGYTSRGVTVGGTEIISVQLSSNKLVPLFLTVGTIFIIIGLLIGILRKNSN